MNRHGFDEVHLRDLARALFTTEEEDDKATRGFLAALTQQEGDN